MQEIDINIICILLFKHERAGLTKKKLYWCGLKSCLQNYLHNIHIQYMLWQNVYQMHILYFKT